MATMSDVPDVVSARDSVCTRQEFLNRRFGMEIGYLMLQFTFFQNDYPTNSSIYSGPTPHEVS